MKSVVFAVTAFLVFFSSQSFAGRIAGWDADKAIVFDPMGGFGFKGGIGFKKAYKEFEEGRCGLTAQGFLTAEGKAKVVVRYITTEAFGNKIACQKEGYLYGIFTNCDYTSEDQVYTAGGKCRRVLEDGTVEAVRRDGMGDYLQLIRIPVKGKNTYKYFGNSGRWVQYK